LRERERERETERKKKLTEKYREEVKKVTQIEDEKEIDIEREL
jgi:hypothetical protein